MAEVVNTGDQAPNQGAPEGHDATMAAKVDAMNQSLTQEAPKAEEGELIGGKFKSQEDLLKAYQELERNQSKAKPEAPAADDAGEMDTDKASELVEKAGIDMDSLSQHYSEKGELATEHYEALEKAGISREYVDQYIRGVEAEANEHRDSLMNEVGGEEAFGTMSQWAAANLSADDLAEYNEAVDSGDMAVVRSAVMSLAYRYQREAGRDPKLLNGGNAGTGGGFQSVAQLTEAMKDPRYQSDPAYRKEIEQKLSRSNIL